MEEASDKKKKRMIEVLVKGSHHSLFISSKIHKAFKDFQ
ncbi:hypothetical protein HMPREF9176_1109 [Streptococcus downei F0415]|nr:hypothetical protein HMPREF9176_1109 [Streptococcus downei F0415]